MVLYVYWTPSNSAHFRYMSFVIWFIVTMYLSSLAGAYRVLVFAGLQILCATGFVYEVTLIMESQELNGRHLTFSEAACFALTNNLISSPQEDKVAPLESDNERTNNRISEEESTDASALEETEKLTSNESARIKKIPRFGSKSMSLDTNVHDKLSRRNVHFATRATLRERHLLGKIRAEIGMSLDVEDDQVDTDKYMYGALYACIGMLLWKHWWILHILVIPLAYYVVKQLGTYFGFWKMIRGHWDSMTRTVESWCLERHHALVPSNIRGLYKVSVIVDEKLRNALKGSVDAVATTAVIFGLIVFTTCASIFITIQVRFL